MEIYATKNGSRTARERVSHALNSCQESVAEDAVYDARAAATLIETL